MTWLKAIEEKIINKYKVAAECGSNELALDMAVKDGNRMARTIRELAKVANTANCLVGMIRVLDVSSESVWPEFSATREALDILSSDSREAIDDCTAPRST